MNNIYDDLIEHGTSDMTLIWENMNRSNSEEFYLTTGRAMTNARFVNQITHRGITHEEFMFHNGDDTEIEEYIDELKNMLGRSIKHINASLQYVKDVENSSYMEDDFDVVSVADMIGIRDDMEVIIKSPYKHYQKLLKFKDEINETIIKFVDELDQKRDAYNEKYKNNVG